MGLLTSSSDATLVRKGIQSFLKETLGLWMTILQCYSQPSRQNKMSAFSISANHGQIQMFMVHTYHNDIFYNIAMSQSNGYEQTFKL